VCGGGAGERVQNNTSKVCVCACVHAWWPGTPPNRTSDSQPSPKPCLPPPPQLHNIANYTRRLPGQRHAKARQLRLQGRGEASGNGAPGMSQRQPGVFEWVRTMHPVNPMPPGTLSSSHAIKRPVSSMTRSGRMTRGTSALNLQVQRPRPCPSYKPLHKERRRGRWAGEEGLARLNT
jgi:hypothetical protein